MKPRIQTNCLSKLRLTTSRRSLLWALALSLLLALAGICAAHATLVIGSLQVTPDPPIAAEPTVVTITLKDPLLVPVEKALVRVQFRHLTSDGPAMPESVTGSEAVEFLATSTELSSDYFPEPSPGTYEATITAPASGPYTVSIRDTTFRNEEAIANIELLVGDTPNGTVAFVLPPTPTAPRSLSTWLIWIVGIPLLAGVLITVLVLRQGQEEKAEEQTE